MAEEKDRASGITTIAAEVIETIMIQTAVETKGVSRISPHSSHPGVKLKIDGKTVNADVFVILKAKEKDRKSTRLTPVTISSRMPSSA